MYSDVETDTDYQNISWENIPASADYELLQSAMEKRGRKYTFAGVVKFLQRVSPHIRWHTTEDGDDGPTSGYHRWPVICVPNFQIREAERIFDRFCSGDDLSNYSYTDIYPEIYDKLRRHKSKPKDNVVKVRSLLKEYECIIFNHDLDLVPFLDSLSALLPQLYFYGNSLPHVMNAPSYGLGMESGDDCELSDKLSTYDEIYSIPDPYSGIIQTFLLSNILESIYDDVEQGLNIFSVDDPDSVAAAVSAWAWTFSREDGWGRNILIALLAVRQARLKEKSKADAELAEMARKLSAMSYEEKLLWYEEQRVKKPEK